VTETNTVYYHHDGLGSTVALTDSTGNVVESYTYDVYGQPSFLSTTYHLLPTSAVTNRFLFTGREYLAELGLYDYRHRFYSPVLGRFLQIDPMRLGAGDENLYRYVGNGPLMFFDPMGLRIWFAGVEANFFGMYGGEVSAGSYLETGKESGDIGGYVTGGGGVGYNVNVGLTAGFINGELSNLRGTAMNFTAGVPWVSITRIVDPNSSGNFFGFKPIGWAISVGPGPTPVSLSESKVWTVALSGREYVERKLEEWLSQFMRRISGNSKDSKKPSNRTTIFEEDTGYQDSSVTPECD